MKPLRLPTILLALLTAASSARGAPDKRDAQAAEAFAAGRYQEALDLFAKLYVEKNAPLYVRAIGRCYQKLGKPDEAISKFQDYLRQDKKLKPARRAEVQGFIKEMQDLKAKQEEDMAAQRKAQEDQARQAEAERARVQAAEAEAARQKAEAAERAARDEAARRKAEEDRNRERQAALAAPSSPAFVSSAVGPDATPHTDARPVYARWWFWTIVGVVAAAGAGATFVILNNRNSGANDPTCPVGVKC